MRIKVNDKVVLDDIRCNTGTPYGYNGYREDVHGTYPEDSETTATVIELWDNSALLRIKGTPNQDYIEKPLHIPNTLVLWYNKSSIIKVLTNTVTYEESL